MGKSRHIREHDTTPIYARESYATPKNELLLASVLPTLALSFQRGVKHRLNARYGDTHWLRLAPDTYFDAWHRCAQTCTPTHCWRHAACTH